MVVSRAQETQSQAPTSPQMLSKSGCNMSMQSMRFDGKRSAVLCQSVDCSSIQLTNRAAKAMHGFTLTSAAPFVDPASTAQQMLLAAASQFVHCAVPATRTPNSTFTVSETSHKKRGGDVQTKERLQRSRERNRIHARKTRLRKKEQMQTLQGKADELKAEQIRLKQIINDKNTANILVGLFATSSVNKQGGDTSSSNAFNEDPLIEELLRRPTSDIPDSTNIAELPSLILPGQHASKKLKASSSSSRDGASDAPSASAAATAAALIDDGIDYDLLGKDRAACSPEELDKIRRERNRMHAKRTRDRKRMFMEELAEICRKLEDENTILRSHLYQIDPDYKDEHFVEYAETDEDDLEDSSTRQLTMLSNSFSPLSSKPMDADQVTLEETKRAYPPRRSTFDQIQTLLAAATSFDLPPLQKRTYANVSSSDDSNDESTHEDSSLRQLAKRRRQNKTTVPLTSTMTPTAVGC